MKDTFYFPHDCNATHDPKIVKLRMNHGWEGSGIYWGLVESLYGNEGRLPCDYEMLAYEFDVKPDLLEKIINSFGLFYVKDRQIGSKAVDERLKERQKRLKMAKKNGSAGGKKSWASKTEASAGGSVEQPVEQPSTYKVKESKVKETLSPTLGEVAEFCKEHTNLVDPKEFFAHYSANGWMIGKSKMVDWKAAVIGWEQKRARGDK